ncbi:homoserine kinase [Paenibacillus sp. UNCCL117]|uniref:homoserine kinase n=1 Tax=unclassified Paenibacillus TaxID=185978 RepID=UPI00088DC8D5|nr:MULTISPECIES: homoserine kinase [unclassified Paenibacillus]SDD23395.1 homoserine kinase [Paenibacillus sp. cl123]SFW41691.1 homoserine kinase [Paenibacillus sp. UNCCL117]
MTQTTKRKVRVQVPASTANLGPGFDTLGMALNLYAWIEMSMAEETRFTLYGEQMQGIPTDKSNLLYEVAKLVFERAGLEAPELEIAMYSDIPLTRGLGSSASAIVGALAAANALIGGRFTDDELFQFATELEQHPDNVGASLFGGIVVAFWDGERAEHIRIEPHESIEVLVAIPHFQLATEKARGILPREQSLDNAVFNVGHSSVLVAAFCTGRLDMISRAMKDALHQPYRAPMVPGLSEILAEATEHGALGVALSGAGPTILALVDRDSQKKAELEAFMQGKLRSEGIDSTMLWLLPDKTGVIVQEAAAGEAEDSLLGAVKGAKRP